MTNPIPTNILPLSPMPTLSLPCSPPDLTRSALPHTDEPIEAKAIWRTLPGDAMDVTHRDALAMLLVSAHPFGIPHWSAAVTGDAEAAITAALLLCGVDVMNGMRHDLAMSAVLAHAINGNGGARCLLVSTLERRALVDNEAAALARSWRRKIDEARKSDGVRLPRATALAVLEALS